MKAAKEHCKYCFEILLAKLQNKPTPKYPKGELDAQVPIFVTWKKNGDLRGCIGTFSPGKLSTILGQYALIAAMEDSRFKPVKMQQVKELSVGVSLLINFQQINSPYDWTVGKHGIRMTGEIKGRKYSGTFLPQVASQQKWDQSQTLQYLVQKAGYYGDYKDIQGHLKVTTYESSKAYMSFEEFTKSQ